MNKLISFTLAALLLMPLPALRAAEPSRERLSFDQGWLFHKGDIPFPEVKGHYITYTSAKAGAASGAAAQAFDDSDWQPVDLPHDWASESPIEKDANIAQGYRKRGFGWYRRHFQVDPADRGFKNTIIKPAVVGDVTWVKSHHDSPYGKIVSNWKREGKKLMMDVTIPPNSTGTIFVPTKDAATVTESGKPFGEAEGVKFLRMENNAAVYAVGSGTYRFQATLPESVKGNTH